MKTNIKVVYTDCESEVIETIILLFLSKGLWVIDMGIRLSITVKLKKRFNK